MDLKDTHPLSHGAPLEPGKARFGSLPDEAIASLALTAEQKAQWAHGPKSTSPDPRFEKKLTPWKRRLTRLINGPAVEKHYD